MKDEMSFGFSRFNGYGIRAGYDNVAWKDGIAETVTTGEQAAFTAVFTA